MIQVKHPITGHQLAKGLVFYWNGSFGPSANVVDFSLQRNHGVLDAAWAGDHLSFTNNTDDINLGTSEFGIDVTDEYTVVLKILFNSRAFLERIFTRNQFAHPWDWQIDSGSSLVFRNRDSGGIVSSSIPSANITNGKIHHIVGTYNSSQQAVYLDGVQVDSDATSGTLGFLSATATTIGQDAGAGQSSFDGDLYIAMLYNRCLSAGEINALYNDPEIMFRHDNLPLIVSATSVGGAPPVGSPPRHPLLGPLNIPLRGVA